MSNLNSTTELRQADGSSNTTVICRWFYFDQNSRIYEMNGEKRNSPFHAGYFRPIKIIGENNKEYLCEYGTINKKSKMYSFGRNKYKAFTEQEMKDDVYVNENSHKLAEKVRRLSANVLRKVETLLTDNGI